MEIKNQFTGAVIFACDDCNTIAETVKKACALKIDLSRAYLSRANLSRAESADLVIARTRILSDGDLIGWKKCLNGVIVKLKIPASAKRSNAFGRKCRAEFAELLEIFGAEIAKSQHNNSFEYRVGETVKPHSWDDNWMEECSGGIHFYITRIEAENH